MGYGKGGLDFTVSTCDSSHIQVPTAAQWQPVNAYQGPQNLDWQENERDIDMYNQDKLSLQILENLVTSTSLL